VLVLRTIKIPQTYVDQMQECYKVVVYIDTAVLYRAITGYKAKLPIFLSTCHDDRKR